MSRKKEWKAVPCPIPNATAYSKRGLMAILAREDDLLHLSISHRSRYPSWDEIKDCRYELMPGNINVGMILPPKDQYVNLHEFCFHLWELTDSELGRAL